MQCVFCDAQLDCHRCVGEAVSEPRAGDINMCAYCGGCMIYEGGDPITSRAATEAELREIGDHPLIPLAHAVLKAFREVKNREADSLQ